MTPATKIQTMLMAHFTIPFDQGKIPPPGSAAGDIYAHTTIGAGITVAVNENDEFVNTYFRVTQAQPGNNWIVVVHDEQSVLNDLEFLAGALLVRPNGFGNAGPGYVNGKNQTDTLVAQRTLWFELDSMPPPPNNRCLHPDWDPEDACSIGQIDPVDFLAFMNEYLAGTEIIAAISPSNARPNLPAFLQYNVTPTKSDVVVRAANEVRDLPSVEHFWAIQLVTAYESSEALDGDSPDVSFAQWFAEAERGIQLVTVGYAFGEDGRNPTVVFTEEIRDLKERRPHDLKPDPRLTTIVAAHEAMHRFYGWHNSFIENVSSSNLMNGQRSMASFEFLASRGLGDHSLAPTDMQFQYLQSRLFPV